MTAADEEFGDRHLRADPAGKLAETPPNSATMVIVSVGPELVENVAGRLGIWLCINLLARLDGLVSRISLRMPNGPACNTVARLMSSGAAEAGKSFAAQLERLVHDITNGRTAVSISSDTSAITKVQIVLGNGTADASAQDVVWCIGQGWKAYAGRHKPVVFPNLGPTSNPLGIYLAVCYAVGEAFKSLRGLKPTVRNGVIDSVFSSLWTGTNAASWDELEDGPAIHDLILPSAYVVGAGAVGQAAAFAAATSTAGAEYLTAIDAEFVDRKNRNRYVLTRKADEGTNKAKLLAAFMKRMGTPAHGEGLHWGPYLSRTQPHPNNLFAAQEAQLRFPFIISGVDGNAARHEIQNALPRDLIGGSTDGLRALGVHYDLAAATACMACYNDVPPVAENAARAQQEIALVDTADRRTHSIRLGIPEEDVDAVLRLIDNPKCGELGRVALLKFAEGGPPAFSVGFVSVAAGILVARNWIRMRVLGAAKVSVLDAHYLNLNFYNGRMSWTEQRPRSTCTCMKLGRQQWRRMWKLLG